MTKVLSILLPILLLSGCYNTSKEKFYNPKTIDFIITNSANPEIKEIIINGKDHSNEEMEGKIKVRVSGSLLTYMDDTGFGWWSNISDKKTYEMDKVETLIADLRIADRSKFIQKNRDIDISGTSSKVVLLGIKEKFKNIPTDILISSEVDLLLNAPYETQPQINKIITSRECSTIVSPLSVSKSRFNNNSTLIALAMANNDTSDFNRFYEPMANAGLLKATQAFKDIVMNEYIGIDFDIVKKCNQDMSFRVSENAIANITLTVLNPVKSLRINQIPGEVFDVSAIIKSINFIGKLRDVNPTKLEIIELAVTDGIISIKNISSKVINVNSLVASFNGNTRVSELNNDIFPNQTVYVDITDINISRFFAVNGYKKGSIDSGIKVKYTIDGNIKSVFFDTNIPEDYVWKNLVL